MLLRLALVALVLALAGCARQARRRRSAPAPAAQVPPDEDDPLFNAVAGEFALEQGRSAGGGRVSGSGGGAQRGSRARGTRRLARPDGEGPGARGAGGGALDGARAGGGRAPSRRGPCSRFQAGDLPAAREALSGLLALPAPEGWMAAVQALAHGGEEARRVLAELAGAGRLPEEARALVVFSQLARRLDDAGLALELAERARRSAPRDEQAALWAAELRRQQGDRAAARAILEAARAELPGSEPLLLALAGLLAEEGRFAEAEELLAAAGGGFEVQRMRAAVAARAGDPVGIRRLYEELREDAAFRAHPRATLLLGELAELARRHEEALAWYRQVPADGEEHEEAERRIALVLAAEGRLEEARAMLPRIEEADPRGAGPVRARAAAQGRTPRGGAGPDRTRARRRSGGARADLRARPGPRAPRSAGGGDRGVSAAGGARSGGSERAQRPRLHAGGPHRPPRGGARADPARARGAARGAGLHRFDGLGALPHGTRGRGAALPRARLRPAAGCGGRRASRRGAVDARRARAGAGDLGARARHRSRPPGAARHPPAAARRGMSARALALLALLLGACAALPPSRWARGAARARARAAGAPGLRGPGPDRRAPRRRRRQRPLPVARGGRDAGALAPAARGVRRAEAERGRARCASGGARGRGAGWPRRAGGLLGRVFGAPVPLAALGVVAARGARSRIAGARPPRRRAAGGDPAGRLADPLPRVAPGCAADAATDRGASAGACG
ncbi:MAG: tetratricopeptide repeat protein [Xanthomonadales bacterium]|nr:tetratricopeptide repeat protein [Xanthomonadales bacterium]